MSFFEDTSKQLQKELSIKNAYDVPRITKVVVNVGVGKNRDNKAHLEAVRRDIAAITGQAPQERHARKSVAGFNVRQGNIVGYRVTLRGKRMEDFVRRFVDVTLPRVRDFRGLSTKAFDRQGNFNVGLREHLPFPEVNADKTDVIFGTEVTFVTNTDSDEVAEKLLRALGFPLAKEEDTEEEVEIETRASRASKEKQKSS